MDKYDIGNCEVKKYVINEKSPIGSIQDQIHADGTKDFYTLRKYWSNLISWCIGLLLTFQIVLTGLVGCNWVNFKDYPWFLEIITTENFVQIIGLAIIVVKFLFNHTQKDKVN